MSHASKIKSSERRGAPICLAGVMRRGSRQQDDSKLLRHPRLRPEYKLSRPFQLYPEQYAFEVFQLHRCPSGLCMSLTHPSRLNMARSATLVHHIYQVSRQTAQEASLVLFRSLVVLRRTGADQKGMRMQSWQPRKKGPIINGLQRGRSRT